MTELAAASTAAEMAIEFKDDENGYLDWLAANPHGYVLNIRQPYTPDYAVLHNAK